MSRASSGRRASRERGFSLFEVVLALAILTGSIAVVGEVVRVGLRNAEAARDITQAELLAESVMAEITAGITAPTAVQQAGFAADRDPDGQWMYSVSVGTTIDTSLLAVQVTVVRKQPGAAHPATFTLSRWIRDPAAIPVAASTSPSSSSGTNQSSSSTQ